jgi:hypothetical protein
MSEPSRSHITCLPVVPGSLEFAAFVRQAILSARPATVAVGLWRGLETEYLSAVARLPELSAISWCWTDPLSGEETDSNYLLVEPCDPFIEAIRTARQIGAEVLFLLDETFEQAGEPPLGSAEPFLEPLPDPYAAARLGLPAYLRTVLQSSPASEADPRAVEAMARALQGVDPAGKTFAFVALSALAPLLRALNRPRSGQDWGREPVAPESGDGPAMKFAADVLNLHPDCLAEVCNTPPHYAERYERWRETPDQPPPDRLHLQRELLREAEFNYQVQTTATLSIWQRRQMARFSRKLAQSARLLLPDLFDLLTAARGVADDNFAWEVWHAAGQWPWQREESDRETVKLTSEDLAPRSRRMRLRRMPLREKRMRLPRGLKDRPKERFPGEWARQIDGDAICSYPPEDLVIEDYGRLLRQKARSMLTDERSHVEPFVTSLLDGIDVRETIRNWHRGEIWVRRAERAAGAVGAVVVVFDADPEDRYGYCTTWLGEHQNESDMAFYSTFPFDQMVGPGIGRALYGGFLMVLPSRRLFDIWSDPDYDMAESKPERLLLAALDYSLERHVLYVAATPPRSIFRTVAARFGRTILYLPLGQLSPSKLKKIRVVHVLDGYHRRSVAKDYLW